MGSSWALAHYIFETSFTPEVIPILVVFAAICILTVGIGLLNSRSVIKKSPLEILRQEG